MDTRADAPRRPWPNERWSRIPNWVYTDPAVFQREQERIFEGPSWNYVCLEAEIPNPGDFKRSQIGVKQEHLDTLADLAIADFAHPNNPKPVTRDDFRKLYQKAL